jgi:hypothetical protein
MPVSTLEKALKRDLRAAGRAERDLASEFEGAAAMPPVLPGFLEGSTDDVCSRCPQFQNSL